MERLAKHTHSRTPAPIGMADLAHGVAFSFLFPPAIAARFHWPRNSTAVCVIGRGLHQRNTG